MNSIIKRELTNLYSMLSPATVAIHEQINKIKTINIAIAIFYYLLLSLTSSTNTPFFAFLGISVISLI